MKNKLIFRILGALSSALIIVSVFVPFVKVTGYSQSLWQTNINTLYLPIIIIVFGAIGVLLFATNLKTELAYSTAGALLFFLITQSIPIINQGTFSTLNIGYYFLVAGTLLTGIMTFLCGLKTKQKVVVDEVKVEEENNEDSMINQIDRLYENQAVQNTETEINQVEMIQPLQSTESLQPLTQTNNSLNIPMEENESQSENLNELLQPTTQVSMPDEQKLENNSIVEQNFEQPTIIKEAQEENKASNPVISEFEAPKQEEIVQPSNPVVSEFTISEANGMDNIQAEQQQSVPNMVSPEINQPSVATTNPVVSEFETSSQFSFGATPQVESQVENKEEQSQTIEPLQTLQPLGGDNEKIDVMADPSTIKDNNSSNLDIFG